MVVDARVIGIRVALGVVDLPHIQERHATVFQRLPKQAAGRGGLLRAAVQIIRVLTVKIRPLLREAHEQKRAAVFFDIAVQGGKGFAPLRRLGRLLLRRPGIVIPERQQHAVSQHCAVHHRAELHLYGGICFQKSGTTGEMVGKPAFKVRAEGAVPQGSPGQGGSLRQGAVFIVGGGFFSAPQGGADGHGQQQSQKARQEGPIQPFIHG